MYALRYHFHFYLMDDRMCDIRVSLFLVRASDRTPSYVFYSHNLVLKRIGDVTYLLHQ